MSFCLLPTSPGRSSRAELAIQDCLSQDLRAEAQENVILNIQKHLCISSSSAQDMYIYPCKGFPLLPFIPWLIFLISWCT